MKQSERAAICLTGVLVFGASAQAITTEAKGNPYQAIVERNVFALKPAPRPEDNPPPKPPTPPIELQGITDMSGHLLAMFSTTTPGSKPGEPPKKTSMVLGVGERDGDIEVLEIDPQSRTVKFDNHGTPETKELVDPKTQAGPAGAIPAPLAGVVKPAIPGAPARGVVPHPAPAAARGHVPTPVSANSALRSIPMPGRPVRTTAAGGVPSPVFGGGVPAPTAANAQPPTKAPLTPEEQVAVWAVQKAADPGLPPLPGEASKLVQGDEK